MFKKEFSFQLVFVVRLYDQGHLVVGLDGIEGPVLDFFQEQDLEYRREEMDNLIRYSVTISFPINIFKFLKNILINLIFFC